MGYSTNDFVLRTSDENQKAPLIFKIATTQEELDNVFKLRYQVYCKEYAYLNPSNYPDSKERDDWDQFSTQFIALNSESSQVLATVRLIQDSPKKLRVEDYADISFLPRHKIREISRLTLCRELRANIKGSKVLLWLCKLMYLFSIQTGIRYWVGTMFIPTWKLFLHQGIYFTFIGDQDYWPKKIGHPVFPVLLDLGNAKFYLNYQNPKLYEFFTGDKSFELSPDDPQIKEILLKLKEDLEKLNNINSR